MCGIIAYTGSKAAAPILMGGLSRLEYRGYDSAGVAVIGSSGEVAIRKAAGKMPQLADVVSNNRPGGYSGIGHTRWATHGAPTYENAHPHTDCRDEVAVVHNGIVENFVELREELRSRGHVFSSYTDSECIPHLIESYMAEGLPLEEAVRRTAHRIEGAHAVVAVSRLNPGKLVAFRLGNAGGLVVGYGADEMFIASDLPAILPHTRRVVYLVDGETVSATRAGASYRLLDGSPVDKSSVHVPYDPVLATKGGYRHFMLKEINDQPEVVTDAMRRRALFDTNEVVLEGLSLSDRDIADIRRVVLIGMGSSLHAAMVGRFWIEALARIQAEADNASEFRYRDPVIDRHTLVVSVCQSGETADTLAAMELAARKGAKQVTLCNYEGTQATRIADGSVMVRAGLEVGVAGSKTFTCSLTTLYLLAIYLGLKRGTLTPERRAELIRELMRLPGMLSALLDGSESYENLARRYAAYPSFLFLGRGIQFPMAMEGALKLKEVSYVHAEGYAAGEMKHGPIALIDDGMPVVALAPRDALYQKMVGNINEVRARGGKVIAIATEGDQQIEDSVDDVIFIPAASGLITPMLTAVPMQLLAYHVGVRLGCDVDQPRNLAKSVTVE